MDRDTYCCICGNSCKDCDLDYLEELFECSEYIKENNIDIKDLKIINKKQNWIKKSMMLMSNNINI
jgi:hypothetical protein